MQRSIVAVVVCASLVFTSTFAFAGNPPDQSGPTRAEVQKKAMQEGPSTSQQGYLTYKDPAPAHRPRQPADPKLMRPLTQRETGMLFNACSAYPECQTAYEQAHERYQAQLRAKAAADKQGE